MAEASGGLEVVAANVKYPTQLHVCDHLVLAGGVVLGGCGDSRVGGIAVDGGHMG